MVDVTATCKGSGLKARRGDDGDALDAARHPDRRGELHERRFLGGDGDPSQDGSVNLQLPVETHELEVWVSYEDDDGPHRECLDVLLS